MKPCMYELDMEECAEDFLFLRAYLEEHLGCGESVELWSVWVGSGSGKLAKYRGSLNDFDLDAFTQLWERVPLLENGQTCLTITADPERSRNGKQSNRTDQ